MHIEIRPYEEGEGLWIDGEWLYGVTKGRCDANSVCHIIALHLREKLGIEVTYEYKVPK